MTYSSKNPRERFRAVVLGGGIHGVGVLHDLASRGWRDILLVEKSHLGHGTSSRSTKLIHGGLRYLEHARDFPLVAEGLRERKLLMELAPDLVKPLPLVFPVLKSGGVNRWVIKAGLTTYDLLARGQSIGRHFSISPADITNVAPPLNSDLFKHFYVFYDGQTDDLALVHRVAKSAQNLGARISEGTFAEKIVPVDDGYEVYLNTPAGSKVISTRYVINALGPWAHELFTASHLTPVYDGINNKGSHIIVGDLGLKMGVFLQSPEDGRIFFVLPWKGKTLIGTTETDFPGPADTLVTDSEDRRYLLDHCNRYFRTKITEDQILSQFSGLRWLARDKNAALSDTSRSHVVSQHRHGVGVIYTIYGGKLTAYRALSEEIGDLILRHFGEDLPTKTHDPSAWVSSGSYGEVPPISTRFDGM